MPHYVANKNPGPRVGEWEHVEKVTAHGRRWNVAMVELDQLLLFLITSCAEVSLVTVALST